MCVTLRDAARQFHIHERHESLLCELNGIENAERDLRLSHRREFLLLPPEAIVKSERKYCLMKKGENLKTVLGRRGINGGCWNVWWGEFLKGNPWADPKQGGLGWEGKQEHDLQYVLLPEAAISASKSLLRRSAPVPVPASRSC